MALFCGPRALATCLFVAARVCLCRVVHPDSITPRKNSIHIFVKVFFSPLLAAS